MTEETSMMESAKNCKPNAKIYNASVLLTHMQSAFEREVSDVHDSLKLEDILQDAPGMAKMLKSRYGDKMKIFRIKVNVSKDTIVEHVYFDLKGLPTSYSQGLYTRTTDKDHQTISQEYVEFDKRD